MGVAKVATVHWYPVEVDRRSFGFGVFVLPAVPLGQRPAIITVPDKIQTDRGPYGESTDKRRRSIRKFPETGEVIARDIVQATTELGFGMQQGCHPGIWRVRESMPLLYEEDFFDENKHLVHRAGEHQVDAEGTALWRPATTEEAASMWTEDEAYARKSDAAYAEFLIGEANGRKEELWRFITPITRAAASHYKIVTLWNTKAGALERESCPWCSEQIIKGSALCKHCGKVIDAEKAMLIEERQKNVLLRLGRKQPQVPVGIVSQPTA